MQLDAIVDDFARFVVAVGIDPDDPVVEEFPDDSSGDTWAAYVLARGFSEDDLAAGRQLRRAARDFPSRVSEYAAQRLGAEGDRSVRQLLTALEQVADESPVETDFDPFTRRGFGVDTREILSELHERSGKEGWACLIKVWADDIARAWVGTDLVAEWIQAPSLGKESDTARAVRRAAVSSTLAALTSAGFDARWDADGGTGRLTIAGLKWQPQPQ